jgi:hypothetical protein
MMMTTQPRIDATSLAKFNGKNFTIYKTKIRALLRQYDLIHVIDRSKDDAPQTMPTMTTAATSSSASNVKAKKTEAMTDEDRKKAYRAYGILIASLDDARTQMVMHIEEGDAAGVWRTLCAQYERTSTASKAHTRSMLHKTRMELNEEIDLYKSRIIELKMRLASMGELVSDGELIYVILEGLPDSYAALKQSLEVQDDYPFEKICGHAFKLKTEQRHKAGVKHPHFVINS